MDPELAVFVGQVERHKDWVSREEVDRQLTNRKKLTLRIAELEMPDTSSREAFETWADDASQQLKAHNVGVKLSLRHLKASARSPLPT